jgi:hemin uptake protein HemP
LTVFPPAINIVVQADTPSGGALTDNERQDDKPAAAQPLGKTPRMILSRDLFAGGKLVIIRHEQEDYRLQVTAAGKLILTK